MSDVFMLTRRQLNRITPYFPVSHGIPRVDDRNPYLGSDLVLCIQRNVWLKGIGCLLLTRLSQVIYQIPHALPGCSLASLC